MKTDRNSINHVKRRCERVDGGGLEVILAHTGDLHNSVVRWDNPFRSPVKGRTPQWHDDEISAASCLMSLVQAVRRNTQPIHGSQQARLDQEIILALWQYASQDGQPVWLPIRQRINQMVGGML